MYTINYFYIKIPKRLHIIKHYLLEKKCFRNKIKCILIKQINTFLINIYNIYIYYMY